MREKTLYEPSFEHDNCGICAIVNIKGEKSHAIVDDALKIVENLEHRAGKDGEGKTGDGVGILTQIPHKFFQKVQINVYTSLLYHYDKNSSRNFRFFLKYNITCRYL